MEPSGAGGAVAGGGGAAPPRAGGSGAGPGPGARGRLEGSPDDPETLNYAADVALLRGNLAEARRLFEHAIALGHASRNLYRARRAKTGLGFVLWQQGDPA